MLYGIVLVDNTPFRLDCSVQLKRGRGEIAISALTDSDIEEVINNAIRFANTIFDLEERPFPDLSNHDLIIQLRTAENSYPISGRSYGLLLSLGIILALRRTPPTLSAAVSGEVAWDGAVLGVGGIRKKREGAKQFGLERMILPLSQFDFFVNDLIQIPVSTIFEAFTAVTYGEAQRP